MKTMYDLGIYLNETLCKLSTDIKLLDFGYNYLNKKEYIVFSGMIIFGYENADDSMAKKSLKLSDKQYSKLLNNIKNKFDEFKEKNNYKK